MLLERFLNPMLTIPALFLATFLGCTLLSDTTHAADAMMFDAKVDTKMRKGDSDNYGDGKAAGFHLFLDKLISLSFESSIYTPQANRNGIADSRDTGLGMLVFGQDARVAAERAEGGHPRFGYALGLGLENGFALTTGHEVERWLHGGNSPRLSDGSTTERPAIQLNAFAGETGIALIGIDFAASVFGFGGINIGTVFDDLDLAAGLVFGERDAVGRFRPQLRGMSISPYGAGLLVYGLIDARAFAYDSVTQLAGTQPVQAEVRIGFHSPTVFGVWIVGEYLHRLTREIKEPLSGHENPVDWLTAGIGYEF